MTPVDVGKRAPDFNLPRTMQESVSLHDVLKDKVAVVAFYVLDFSST